MAWNGSKATAAQGTAPKGSGPIPVKRHRIFLWCLLGTGIAVAVIALCLFYPGEESVPDRVQTNDAPRIIHDVKPAQPDKGVEAEIKSVDDDGEWHPPKNAYKDERGIWRYPGGMRVYDPTRPRKTTNLRMEGDKPSIFR